MLLHHTFRPSPTLAQANHRLALLEKDHFLMEAKNYQTETKRWTNHSVLPIDEVIAQLFFRYDKEINRLKNEYRGLDNIPIWERRNLARDYADWSKNVYYQVTGHSEEYGIIDPPN